MPNWCYNELLVDGQAANIWQFKALVKGKDTDLSLDNLVPMPPRLLDVQPEEGNPNWTQWRLDNWGTKWDVKAELVNESENSLHYTFLSAGSAPVEWLNKVSIKMPALQFQLRYQLLNEECRSAVIDVVDAEGGEISETSSFV